MVGEDVAFAVDQETTSGSLPRAIEVPAGKFNAFRLEWRSARADASQGLTVTNAWFAPEKVRRPVLREEGRSAGGKETGTERIELVSYKQS